jgi:hypothetical protein
MGTTAGRAEHSGQRQSGQPGWAVSVVLADLVAAKDRGVGRCVTHRPGGAGKQVVNAVPGLVQIRLGATGTSAGLTIAQRAEQEQQLQGVEKYRIRVWPDPRLR